MTSPNAENGMTSEQIDHAIAELERIGGPARGLMPKPWAETDDLPRRKRQILDDKPDGYFDE